MSWSAITASPAGSTTQFQYNNAGSFAGASNLTFATNGPVVTSLGVGSTTPSASGAGIAFPATQSASTDANTLDDYEEGTWTPSTNLAYQSSPTLTYTTQTGTYTKIGRMVTLAFVIEYATFSGGGGPIFLAGLPFTPAQTTDPRFQGTVYLSGPNTPASTVSVTVGYAKLDNGSYYNCFICSRDDLAMANGGTINCADLSAGDIIAGTWTYFV
jgi:hypothetical protein